MSGVGGKLRVLHEATCTDQACVLRGGSFGIDELAGVRIHSITANQESTFGCGSVLEGGNHSLLTCREANKLLAKGHLDSLALDFLT